MRYEHKVRKTAMKAFYTENPTAEQVLVARIAMAHPKHGSELIRGVLLSMPFDTIMRYDWSGQQLEHLRALELEIKVRYRPYGR